MAGLALPITQFRDSGPGAMVLLVTCCAMNGIVAGAVSRKRRSRNHDEIGGFAPAGRLGTESGHIRGVGGEGKLTICSANRVVAPKTEPSVRDGAMLCGNGMKRRDPGRGQGFVAMAFRTPGLEKGVIRGEMARTQDGGGFAIIAG